MLAWVSNKLRGSLNGSSRRVLRRVADTILAPVGSINGAREPTNAVAITFDDGPDPAVTPDLLDLLKRRGARATFFVMTEKAAAQPQTMRRMVDEGHEVALHFDRHDRLTELPPKEVAARMAAARQELEKLAGPVRFFRPPYGAQSLNTYLIARRQGLQVVSWGPFAEDWMDQTPECAAGKALNGLKGGSVLLLHDGLEMPNGETPPIFDRIRMVDLLLDGMSEQGLAATTVGALIDAGGPRATAWFRL